MSTTLIYKKRYDYPPTPLVLDGKEKLTPREKFTLLDDDGSLAWLEGIKLIPKDNNDEKEEFIECSKELSQIYEISIDIFEGPFCIITNLYLNSCHIFGEFKELLQNLILISDSFDAISRRGTKDILLVLVFNTHDVYLNGKKRLIY